MKKEAAADRISVGTRIAYGCGDTACNIVYGMISSLLTLFYTDYAGISPITVGIVMLVSRVFDGSSDLIMGFIVDRTKSRWGKSRPWLLWMMVPYGIAAVLMYTVPHTTDFLKGIYIFVTYNLTTTVIYTAINVPYGSLSTMMTRDSYQQDMLSIFRMILSPVGRIISVTATMPLVKLLGDDQSAWIKTMCIWVVIAMLLLLFCFLRCEETVKIRKKEADKKIPVGQSIKGLVTNKYFWCVLGLWSIQVIHQTVIGTDLPYYCKYIFGNDSWMYSVLYFLETVIMILGAMACPVFIKRWGKRKHPGDCITPDDILESIQLLLVFCRYACPVDRSVAAVCNDIWDDGRRCGIWILEERIPAGEPDIRRSQSWIQSRDRNYQRDYDRAFDLQRLYKFHGGQCAAACGGCQYDREYIQIRSVDHLGRGDGDFADL